MLTYGRRIPLPELDKRIEVRRKIYDYVQPVPTFRNSKFSCNWMQSGYGRVQSDCSRIVAGFLSGVCGLGL